MGKKSLDSFENLLSVAFARTRERFISFFLTNVILYVLIFVTFLLGVLVLVVVSALTAGGTPSLLAFFLRAVAIIAFALAFWYVVSWGSLTTIAIIAEREKIGVIDAYKKTQPLTWRYMWIYLLYGLFIIGLIPSGIVLLLIPFIVWSIWGSFFVFVYLDQRKTGLENLWISRAMVNQNFWGVTVRLFLMVVALIAIFIIIVLSRNGFLIALWQIVNTLFIAPLLVSFTHTIYTQLDRVESAKAPKVWVIASLVGLVILVLVSGFMINVILKRLPTILNKQYQQQLQQQYQKLPLPSETIPYGQEAI